MIYEVADIKTWANLGLHYAEKIRGAIALQTYRVNGNKTYQQQAIRHLSKGLEYWDKVIEITRPLYNDMPLVHYTFAVPVFHRGHLAVFFEHVLKVGLARKA